MKIELQDKPWGKYYTVLVEKDELVLPSGKKMGFSTWLGTIDSTRGINLWTPAGYCPRGYKKAAMAVLEEVQAQLKKNERYFPDDLAG